MTTQHREDAGMFSTLSIAQRIVVTGAALACGLIVGMVGLAIGVDCGGNFCHACEFNDVTGYEATGQIGFLIGAPIGLLTGALAVRALLARRNARRRGTRPAVERSDVN